MVAATEVDRTNARRERASELLAEDVSMGQIATSVKEYDAVVLGELLLDKRVQCCGNLDAIRFCIIDSTFPMGFNPVGLADKPINPCRVGEGRAEAGGQIPQSCYRRSRFRNVNGLEKIDSV